MIRTAACLAGLALASPATALDAATERLVTNTRLSTVYHEIGHALIDVLSPPVPGQEDAAADTRSVVLVDAFSKEEDAAAIIYDAASSCSASAEDSGDDEIFRGAHGTDLQRYDTTVCLFCGADPRRARRQPTRPPY